LWQHSFGYQECAPAGLTISCATVSKQANLPPNKDGDDIVPQKLSKLFPGLKTFKPSTDDARETRAAG
jgi:hypothetical protein